MLRHQGRYGTTLKLQNLILLVRKSSLPPSRSTTRTRRRPRRGSHRLRPPPPGRPGRTATPAPSTPSSSAPATSSPASSTPTAAAAAGSSPATSSRSSNLARGSHSRPCWSRGSPSSRIPPSQLSSLVQSITLRRRHITRRSSHISKVPSPHPQV